MTLDTAPPSTDESESETEHGAAPSDDADGLEVLDDQIGEIAATEFVGVEPPQFANAHFSVVAVSLKNPVVEDSQASCHGSN